jgi:16S rRNA (cytosine967-C5)-methyltransferase
VTPAARIAAAIDLLSLVEADAGTPAPEIANAYFRARRFIGASDRRAISDHLWNCVRAHRRLAWWLAPCPTPRLRVAASLLFEGAALADIARSFSGERFAPATLAPAERDALARLEGQPLLHHDMPEAVRLELPDWLLPRLSASLGEALTAEMAAIARPAPVDLRVNTLKTTRPALTQTLRDLGVTARPTGFSPWGLRVDERRLLTDTEPFRAGLFEIQDEGSQLIAALVDARPGMRVADICAGAGGKTLALAMTMEHGGYLLASDVSATRLDEARHRLARAGASLVDLRLLPRGNGWQPEEIASFDRVLVDAPCTSTGTWRRDPSARFRLQEAHLQAAVTRQAAILDRAAPLVRIGGHLVYATCSLLSEENEAQVSGFLSRQSGFRLLPLERAWPLPGPPPARGDFLCLRPSTHETDGFFAAAMERVG